MNDDAKALLERVSDSDYLTIDTLIHHLEARRLDMARQQLSDEILKVLREHELHKASIRFESVEAMWDGGMSGRELSPIIRTEPELGWGHEALDALHEACSDSPLRGLLDPFRDSDSIEVVNNSVPEVEIANGRRAHVGMPVTWHVDGNRLTGIVTAIDDDIVHVRLDGGAGVAASPTSLVG